MKFERKTLKQIAEMSPEEKEAYYTAKEANDADVRKGEIDAALDPILKGQKTTEQQIKDIAETVNSIEEKVRVQMQPEMKGFLHTVIKENHEAIVEAFKGREHFSFTVEKVPAMHMTNNGTVSNVSGLTYPTGSFEVDNDIALIRVPENFILNVIRNTQRANVPEYVIKKQQVPGEGAAAVVAEGAVKPLIQKKFQNTSTMRKKYAGRIEWSEEFVMDFQALLDAIIDMFELDVLTAWQDGLVDQIEANATAYVASSLDDTLPNPDNGLAIVAVMQQIKSLGYNPNFAIMNPADIDAAVYTQDQNGNFSLKPYIDASGNKIAGLTVIPTLKMNQGEALVGDFSIYKEIHTGFIFRRGQYDDQFIRNEYTAVGEVFSVINAAPAQYPAVVKINLATVKAALLKPAA
ncbi:Phage capsid family protein [Chryseobacterium oranimense]|uniref:Phage capsid family protein n=1 Tax=Chryseobacterium oranimense TaxID=421058 RepID=A0A1M5X8V9_9FLAO|nr:phage major capsid protein [Chryseobacterium oranimense]SHH96018.1 Phage capsid family protein [Chryseobacterium oranimense]